jgi:hypothetical protein
MMSGPFSPQLLLKVREALERGEQAILFQNRRGYAPMLECRQCGWVPRCQRCDVSLTYHRQLNQLSCHYCGQTYRVPAVCPCCGSASLETRGYGTEKIEAAVRNLEKKGIRLYGLAPIPFLVSLLRQSEPAAKMSAEALPEILSASGITKAAAVHVGRSFFETALGKVLIGVLAAGVVSGGVMGYRYWKDLDEIRANWACQRTFRPAMDGETRTRLQKGWHRAVRCAIAWAEDGED